MRNQKPLVSDAQDPQLCLLDVSKEGTRCEGAPAPRAEGVCRESLDGRRR